MSNGRGQAVRTLVAAGPTSGSATWDGRDEHGGVAPDGHYTLMLTDADGRDVGASAVVLDTNRSPIHDVASPAGLVIRNATCALPETGDSPVWLPAEDGLLLINRYPTAELPAGLVRLDLDGSPSYVAADDWYANAHFASDRAVSPDGLEVLVEANSQVASVDLATGLRRAIGAPGNPGAYYRSGARWSPDGRFILIGGRVYSRDGLEVANLEQVGFGWSQSWDWSPDSTRLALGDLIVSRGGTVLHASTIAAEEYAQVDVTQWRGDGKIVARLSACAPSDQRLSLGARRLSSGDSRPTASPDSRECSRWLLIDPADGAATDLGWDPAGTPAWSPDGTRAIVYGRLYDAAGNLLGRPLPASAQVSPYSGAALLRAWRGDPADPLAGQICGEKGIDVFAASNLANLATDLRPTRLPANSGLLLYGTVGDRNLDHYQLDYARRSEPGVWRPIGPAQDAPTVDDQLAVWAPSEPGTYFIRLSAVDRAGNRRVRTRAVAWDRVPALANFSQSGFFLSPAGDGVKEVRLDYFVVEPTRVEIRVTGPEPVSPSSPPSRLVRSTSREYGSIGPQSFAWDGRDDSNAVVPDGRYTVLLNGLPFRVEVDSTPPEIDYRFDDPHVVAGAPFAGPVCTTFRRETDPAVVELGRVMGWQERFAVDPNLKAWRLVTDSLVMDSDSEPVYEPEIGPDGLPILDQGVPRVRRENGRPVRERRERGLVGGAEGVRFEAEDLAGNHSVVAVPSVTEGVWALGAAARCVPVLGPPVVAEKDAPDATKPPVNELAPRDVVLAAGQTLGSPPTEQNVRFSFEPKDGGVRQELPMTGQDGRAWYLAIPDFETLGDPTATYRGRFVGDGTAGEVAGDDFLFRPCPEWLVTEVVPGLGGPFVFLRSQTREPLARAWVTVTVGKAPPLTIELDPLGGGTFMHSVPTGCEWRYEARAQTVDGRLLPEPGAPLQCNRVAGGEKKLCTDTLRIEQAFEGCTGSPDRLSLTLSGYAPAGSRVEVERGPADAPVHVGMFVVPPSIDGSFSETMVADVHGEPEGGMPVRGRILSPNPQPGEVPVTAEISAVVDRTPPEAELLLPPDGGLLCASPATGDTISFQVLANDDRSPWLEVHARARPVGGAWSALARTCEEGDTECAGGSSRIPPRRPIALEWGASTLAAGDHESETTFCDQSGNATRIPRSFSLLRQPRPRVVSVSRRLFSPNGDGQADETVMTVRLAQAGQLTVRVHAGAEGGAVVRTLSEQFQTASDVAIAWDGRADSGQTAPDGPYTVVFSVTDPCGGTGEVAISVEIDTVPPEVAITDPAPGQRVSASVDVKGLATDAHFGSWELDLACASEPWSRLDSRPSPVSVGGFLAGWDTSRAPPGECRLRLTARDAALNRSPEAVVAAQVERGDLILRLIASPDVFSPNGDGRRETTTLEYELQRRARVRLQVRDHQGRPLRTFEDVVVREAGVRSFAWDGRNDANEPAAEGDHVLWIRAEDPDTPSVYEEKTTRLVLDRTPPAIAISRPTAGSFVPLRATVRGSITDLHLAEYAITVTPAGDAPIEIARASQERTDSDLGALSDLAEGPATLQAVATDLAENEARLDVPFVVDSTPPRAVIQSPPDAAFLRRGDDPIAVTGLVGDDHLEGWTLRFGTGAEPVGFVTIGQGQQGGSGIALGPWDVRFVPDGVYTLSLVATDRAGWSTESRVVVTLDGRPPTVALSRPLEGGYVTAPGPIVGTAIDANLASWELESAPGVAASAPTSGRPSRTAAPPSRRARWRSGHRCRPTASTRCGSPRATRSSSARARA